MQHTAHNTGTGLIWLQVGGW